MLLPYSIVDATVRKWPTVTLTLIALNVFCFLGQLAVWRSSKDAISMYYGSAVAYLAEHPYLEPPPLLRRIAAVQGGSHATPRADVPDDLSTADVEEEQHVLNGVCARLEEKLQADPSHRFGFTPKDGIGGGMLTYMFLHAGMLHLLGNVWFLWLACACIEDRWGRLAFTLFYLTSGVVAALAHWASAPGSAAPLVGASGAIAGAMGAFLVLFATRRIRFLFLLGFRFGEMTAPAYVMLPAWVVAQVLFAQSLSGDGVAYWAHIGGFAFGAAVAGVFRLTGADERLDAWAAQSA